ncbi:ubiquitin carboxyl-terminal hydrolase 34-like isoform X4 [Haliotis rufescens]|uniref:ubiquitin carboxyl-terminal hydrolase 34-like isoform X4 n=1 Tax=Haliotis rufescens TaxID=6454 RepID=UPI00201F8CC7|nr:ubiquitin carboxyl-terminal hydrolase 34-like isoform X4 [Haliotis rufescens]
MCDVCSDVLVLLENHDERVHRGEGLRLNKREINAVLHYVCTWPQRQCMCCYKDFKNFERLNNIVQVILVVAIRFIQTLPIDYEKETTREILQVKRDTEDKDGASKDGDKNEEKNEKEDREMVEEKEEEEYWSMEEKERLLQFVTKVFLMNFPSYMAYKHIVHSSLEELSQQETSALNNYCEISDPEVPLYLLRNVCFFCDSNGITSLRQCFEKATPDTLPFTFAHLLITLIANLRLWMNIPTVLQCIIPLRTSVIRYMCNLSDKDLRVAGNRSMTDLMWAAVKEPLDTHFTFDKEGLDLAFKYFTCSTLTIRLAGIAQINLSISFQNQINLYNESCNNETLVDADRVGNEVAQWLIDNKIIEHIFGPNLHVEIIKQSQIILNFLAMEWRITNEHIDCVWAASQLKHCSKQVYDILISLIKNLDLPPVQHLLKLVSALEPTVLTESTLYLASALIKYIWNQCATAQHHGAMVQQHLQPHLQTSYTAIRQDEEEMEIAGLGKPSKHNISSSESIQESEEGEHLHRVKRGHLGAEEGLRGAVRDHCCQHHHHHKVVDESESSLGVGSDFSNESEESGLEGEAQAEQLRKMKMRQKKMARHAGEASESDVECTESSDDTGEVKEGGKGFIGHRKVKGIKGMKKLGRKMEKVEESEGESSEVDECCGHSHDEEESDYLNSDEELLKQAKLVRLKQLCPRESEDSSDFDDIEEETKVFRKMKLFQAQQEIQKQKKQLAEHRQHQLLQQAAHMMLRRQGKLCHHDHANIQKVSEVMQDVMQDAHDDAGKDQNASGDIPDKVKLADIAAQEGGSSSAADPHLQQGMSGKGQDTEVFDCTSIIQKMRAAQRQRALQGEFTEDILSPDDGSCHSSHMSAKSDKNMADFDGEEGLSEEELAQINAHAHFNASQMQHLTNMASMYHLPPSVIHHRPTQREAGLQSCPEFTIDDVCKKGTTLLWDIVQEDVAHLLPDGLLLGAEKALHNLVCFSTDKRIKTKFIEACIDNLASHRSVVVSLRLLPKIFNSFQQYRSGADTHAVTMWSENNLGMMKHYFRDLVHYTENRRNRSNSLYSHKDETGVRLDFLTCVFSSMGSPDSFRLNQTQVDELWECLAADPECTDDCLKWFLTQAKSKDHHALGLETFKHIFLEKMPQLRPETMSAIGLNLFQSLSQLARVANASLNNPLSEDQVCGMDQLWSIALRATNKEVSMTAIQYLNNYYISFGNSMLEKEEEFIHRCMKNLVAALENVKKDTCGSFQIIQQGLTLLKNHLEAFRRRYAYHLRNWQIDGKGITSHQQHRMEKHCTSICVLLQPAGMTEKNQLEMMTTDLVAELRAEVARWWEALQKQQQLQRQQAEGAHGVLSPILGAMLGDGPIRMITQGQELTVDMDEKTLGEMQFKNMQLVFVSVGASRQPRKMDGSLPSSSLPSPLRDRLPMMLLLQEPHFDNLFMLLQRLGDLDVELSNMDPLERAGLLAESRRLSRNVWELLMILPTSPNHLNGFKSLIMERSGESGDDQVTVAWNDLLPPSSPHKLYYSLQIVEVLSHSQKLRRKSLMRSGGGDAYLSSGDQESGSHDTAENLWSSQFIAKGGLSHLFNIFISGSLQSKEGDNWSQWNQECLAYLLRLVSQFAVNRADLETGSEEQSETYESPRKKVKKSKSAHEKIFIPRLNQSTINMLNTETVLKILMQILYDAALPEDTNQLYIGSWGRAEVVHCALSFLISLAYSCDEVPGLLCTATNFNAWLKRLTLEAPEPYVRKEACMGLYRLRLGKTVDNKPGYSFLLPILSSLLSFLQVALEFKPQKNTEFDSKEKEPFGPGCRDYFWLVCRFVDSISKEEASSENCVDLNSLAKEAYQLIMERPYLETRVGYEEDDGLIGLLNLLTAVLKHNPPFKTSSDGKSLLDEIFDSLFALPSPTKRYLPRCKSQASRSAAYDLLVEMVKGSVDNYTALHSKMLAQHTKDSHTPYPWDYWPHEDGRSKCGYVGLTNLGATCYMATCMQHLYMIPQARQSVLQAKQRTDYTRHEGTLVELQKMFAYLQESERKAYNPKSFCKAYTMDKQPLNTGEQKDMTEFFTDLITKLEEMGPEMKALVKSLFGGIITNNVVSLDCPHVSRTFEEFYTVRCQVTDMKDLYESLDEVTVKDMLEGDNMYTCSKCQKKVRAEKRACFRKLPKILCFNTMRYTFNMVTMMKEKVNTHFSFPLRLDIKPYMEVNLLGPDKLKVDEEDELTLMGVDTSDEDESSEYELIGVTVHTGTADGGHYYSFIRDRLNKTETGQDKWYLFNDAEVKPFDPSQIAGECFGGEMTSKTYDSVTDKFMDFSFEKTNSAYMLFYERCPKGKKPEEILDSAEERKKFNFELSKDLGDWIWQDNTQFLQDKNLFEHTYFGFMWQICGYITTTLPKDDNSIVPLKAAQLSTSFVLETLIHAKEKPTMLQWIELLTKQFNSCPAACEWFLDHMADSDWWPQQILIKCPNQMVRQMFQRLVIHVIGQLRHSHFDLYMQPIVESEDGVVDVTEIGNRSCVTRFIKKMLTIIEHGVRPHSKYLTEYFAFLLEFAKTGEEECNFLISINAISTMIAFYMGQKAQENYVEILSDDDEEEDVISLTDDNYRPMSLEKMISLIALLVEKSRAEKQLHLSEKDYNSIIGGKGFPFLFNQIRDNINIRQSCNLIFSLTRYNETLAVAVINMVFGAIRKLNPEQSQPFFKLLSMLVEFVGGPPGMPQYTQYVLQRFWELTKCCPQQCLEWMTGQVTRNKLAQAWTLNQMDNWVEPYLIAHNNVRVRNAAAFLLVSLVPSTHFRQSFRSARSMLSPHKEFAMSTEALMVLHQVYEHLLSLLSRARLYVDPQVHGTMKLMCYFAVMTYCLVSKQEKLLFGEYFLDLWQLFQPKLSEPQISMHHNKQTLLLFWHQVCVDCPENVKQIVSNQHVCKNIAFSYILADHDDQDVVMFNRVMLPAYYGLLRMCCQQSRQFTRQLAQHQNIAWAFKNITLYPTQYTLAVEELFKMMKLMVMRYPDSSEDELKAIASFKRANILMYLQALDARSMWQTLISAFKILVESREERMLLIYHQGLQMITEAFFTLHAMYHEATACHVTGDIVDLLTILLHVLECGKECHEKKGSQLADAKAYLLNWEERNELPKKLLTLLNSYTPPEVRSISIDVLKQMILTFQGECIACIVPILVQAHGAFQDQNMPVTTGPYFPRKGQKPIGSKSNIRPPRPQFQMFLHSSQVEVPKGVDEVYDQALNDFIIPYHQLVDVMCRVAVNMQNLSESLISLSAMLAFEAVPLHSPYFAKLWVEIYHSEVDRNYIKILCNTSSFIDYVDAVLLDERLSLNNHIIYQFFCSFFPKVHQQVLNDQGRSLLDSLVASITAEKAALENMKSEKELLTICERVSGDLRAMLLIFTVQMPKTTSPILLESLHYILRVCREHQQQRAEMEATAAAEARRQQEALEQEAVESDAGDEEEDVKPNEDDEDSGETPSKRRRVSNEGDVNVEEKKKNEDTANKPEEKDADKSDSKADISDAKDQTKEDTEDKAETTEAASPKKTPQKSEPTPSTSHDSPQSGPHPGTSTGGATTSRTTPGTSSGGNVTLQSARPGGSAASQSSLSGATSTSASQQTGSRTGGATSATPREKPNRVDMVAKHIETLLALIDKK